MEHIIANHATLISEGMSHTREWASSEEDVRHEFNKLIDVFLKEAGINIRGCHEYGLAGGRVDSKYGGVMTVILIVGCCPWNGNQPVRGESIRRVDPIMLDAGMVRGQSI